MLSHVWEHTTILPAFLYESTEEVRSYLVIAYICQYNYQASSMAFECNTYE